MQYDGQSEVLPLYDKPALLGRNWLSHLRLDWGKIFAVRNNAQLDSLLTEFASVFSDDPGEIRGFEADMHIDDDIQPIFKKAYQVPFAIWDRIKSQLQTGINKGLFTVGYGPHMFGNVSTSISREKQANVSRADRFTFEVD